MLFRGIAYRLRSNDPEVRVFFEAPSPLIAPAVLQELLSKVWGCDAKQIEAYNIYSAEELRRDAAAPTRDDRCLFECGYDGNNRRPLYADMLTSQLLVSPPWLQRLQCAALQLMDQSVRGPEWQATQASALEAELRSVA